MQRLLALLAAVLLASSAQAQIDTGALQQQVQQVARQVINSIPNGPSLVTNAVSSLASTPGGAPIVNTLSTLATSSGLGNIAGGSPASAPATPAPPGQQGAFCTDNCGGTTPTPSATRAPATAGRKLLSA